MVIRSELHDLEIQIMKFISFFPFGKMGFLSSGCAKLCPEHLMESRVSSVIFSPEMMVTEKV